MSQLRQDTRPLYVRASESLRDLIGEHKLTDGDRLPTEAELGDLLGVSRSTIREGLRDLELRGLVRRVHGLGTIVKKSPVATSLNTLESLERLAGLQGWTCGTMGVQIDQGPIPEIAAASLKLEAGTPGTRLERVKTRDGVPMAEMVTWLPASRLSAEELRASFTSSITDLLITRDGHLVSVTAEVSASPATPDEASKLQIDVGSPLVILFETFLDRDDQPTCWSRNAFVPDAISLEVIRRPAGN